MSSPFIQYRDMFGKPGTGVHQYKLKGTSIVDYILTIVAAMILTYFTEIPLVLTTIGLLLAGIIFHKLFGIQSQALNYLGL